MTTGTRRSLTLFSLLFAGEAVFTLPFHIGRYFRPTYVEVLGLSQTELGSLVGTYGIVAMLSYLLGGGLADRFAARKLLVFSLVSTSISGLYLATIPSLDGLRWLYAFWGASTILPFWAALMRATREWGGPESQGKAFGILDGGRGVVAAVMAAVALGLLTMMLPSPADTVTMAERTSALKAVILSYTTATFLAAVFVWLSVPETSDSSPQHAETEPRSGMGKLRQVMRMPVVWLHALVIVAAYSAYKGFDFLSQFTYDVWGWSELSAAKMSSTAAWIRPAAAVGAGLLADRRTCSGMIIASFFLTGAGYAALPWVPATHGYQWLLWTQVFTVCVGIFALRGIYFALLEEAQIPRSMTGTAVGVVSFVGFVPEIFLQYGGGLLIDHWSGGPTGYTFFFTLLACGTVLGMAAAWLLSTDWCRGSTRK